MTGRTILVSFIIILLSAANCLAGLDTLIEAARSQAEIQKQYKEETDVFKKVKAGIESGAITKGQRREDIQRRYGEPVVKVKNLDGKRENWVYKPASSSFFAGIRATLIFAEDGRIDEISIEER